MISVIFHDLNLQKGSFKGTITLTKTLFDEQMVKNHDKNDDQGHEMSSVIVIHFSNQDHDQTLENFSVGMGNGHW